MNNLPTLSELAGAQASRLQGITGWEQVPLLGRANLESLLHIARQTARELMASGADRDDRQRLRAAIDRLEDLRRVAKEKPLLPRLRFENFRPGDRLYVYVGDTERQITDGGWIRATLTRMEKSFKAEWKDGTNTGYYWRLTATTVIPVLPGVRDLPFSTSEPRVLTVGDLTYLDQATTDDPAFLRIFAENARRPWPPIWCLERGLSCSSEQMDVVAWVTQGLVID